MQELVIRSWWVILFAILCYMGYEQSIAKRKAQFHELAAKLKELEGKKENYLQQKEDLLLQIQSQSDPEWIELTLMKGLGLVPEGHIKVLLSKET